MAKKAQFLYWALSLPSTNDIVLFPIDMLELEGCCHEIQVILEGIALDVDYIRRKREYIFSDKCLFLFMLVSYGFSNKYKCTWTLSNLSNQF